MNNTFFRYLLWLILFVVLQTLIFSRLPLGTYVYPMIYVLFILMLPITYSFSALLLWAFLLGLCIDVFTNGILGAHAAATVAIAYIRPFILKLVTVREDRENNTQFITKNTMRSRFFITYISLAIVLHHIIYFLIDTFSFFNIIHTFLLIILSSVLSIIFVFIISSLTNSPRHTS